MTVIDAAAKQQLSRDFMVSAERLPILWHLSEEFRTLIDLLEQPDQDVDAINAEMQRVAGDIVHKADGVAAIDGALDVLANYEDKEAKRLAERAKQNRSHRERLKAYALECMKMMGQDRIETGRFTLRVQQNQISVKVLEASAIPSEYNRTKITVEPDLVAIGNHFKSTGELVPGTEVVRTESLRIS